ncbi:DUF5134 domain-containing protein [Streptomyces sp. NPDC056149]|uniref:DUF5134 domain-containing protein n=1 Tax=Streptomyces sp. NPDC056149 TaxID=3345728 RepID=UPI0035DAA726
MIAASGLRWVLTVLYALPALYGLRSVVARDGALVDRIGHGLHAVMGLLMIAMVWPWGMGPPAGPQVWLFVAGALWFGCAGPLRAQSADRGRALLAALPHVLMMGAMAWMVAVMGSSPMPAGQGGGRAMDEMPGMRMAGPSGATTMGLTGSGQRLTAAVLAVLLVVVALRWLARAFDLARSAPEVASGSVPRSAAGALGPACHAAMGLGMAAMFALLM